MTDSAPDVSSAASVGAPVVSIQDVTHHYGDTVALDGISLDIPSGRMVGIVGPDGVGKSTLMALIAGSKKMQQGKLIVLGGDIADAQHRDDVCPQIAYMPQGLGKNLYLELSVYENVDFMAQTLRAIRRGATNSSYGTARRHRTWPVSTLVLPASFPAE